MPNRRACLVLFAPLAFAAAGCASGPPPAVDLEAGAVTCLTATRKMVDVLARDDGLWLATEGGLLHVSGEAGERELSGKYTRADGLVSNALRALATAPDGSLWIATDDGVSRLRAGVFDRFTARDGLNDPRTYAVAVDASGTVFVGTERGIARFDGTRFVPFSDTHEFARRPTHAIHAAAAGSVWFAKENALTHWLGGSAWEVFQRDPLLPGPRSRLIGNTVRAVASDAQGRPWIGTHTGLGRLDADGWRRWEFAERFFRGNGPRDNRIVTVAVDREGWVWLGYGDTGDYLGGKGATRTRDGEWQHFSFVDGLQDNRVHRVRTAPDGTVWLATSGGAARFDGRRFEPLSALGDLPSNHVTGLERDDDGAVRVTTAGGWATFRGGERVTMQVGRAPNDPGRFIGGAPPRGDMPEGVVEVEIHGMRVRGVELRRHDGSRWLGTTEHGLWRDDGAGWAEVRIGDRGFPRFVTSLLLEDDRFLWIGTVTEGAFRVDLDPPPAGLRGIPGGSGSNPG